MPRSQDIPRARDRQSAWFDQLCIPPLNPEKGHFGSPGEIHFGNAAECSRTTSVGALSSLKHMETRLDLSPNGPCDTTVGRTPNRQVTPRSAISALCKTAKWA
jgi:hypothetical protein